jgi:uncharacterized MnhB-related membrane protein
MKSGRNKMDLLTVAHLLILVFLIATALAAVLAKDLLVAVIIFSAYSFTMAITYLILRSPDVAMTEAAVGAGVTSILFVTALSRTNRKE